ncbi:uncharacterized protein METZ01_LOCUS23018 [marine metagenome]|uniref:Uncharacterized protein n=1 Tax=marine metagenome TaxID=408172 RepID=A0A381PU35_9ZZZZ
MSEVTLFSDNGRPTTNRLGCHSSIHCLICAQSTPSLLFFKVPRGLAELVIS